MVISLALFAASMAQHPAVWVLTVVFVIALHEAGHLLGMLLFGYRDLRVFFIPFFGAAVSGRKETVPARQEAVVLLLGPVPGIFLGLALASSTLTADVPEVYDLAAALVWINALNLLPLAPLDGGRLFQVLFLARRPNATGWVRILTVIGFGTWAWNSGAWVLWVVAGLLLVFISLATHQARAAAAFRAAYPAAARRADELSDDQIVEIVALGRVPGLTKPRTLSSLADWVRDVHGQAMRDRASFLAVLVFLGIYAGAIVAAVAAKDRLSATAAARAEEVVTEGGEL